MKTGFYWDEKCFWFSGGNYAFLAPVGGFVQPQAAGGLPENPETKRRLRNLLDASGLLGELDARTAPAASDEDLRRVHPQSYLDRFKAASDAGGGELGRRTPFGPGGYELAALSTGLAKAAVADVMGGRVQNAYALSRPPGHHCLPDYPNGFCLFANIAVAVEAARASTPDLRVVVLDWDVHHGNGTEAIYLDDPNTLAISIHQENNYPMDTGAADVRGVAGTNMNIPLPPGAGHDTYLRVMDQIVTPAVAVFQPDLIIVACGFDASLVDPLGRMLATAETFEMMTNRVKTLAATYCDGRLVLVHEGGYNEVYVPFCGHHTIAALSGSDIRVDDPFADVFALRQPTAGFQRYLDGYTDEMAAYLLG